MVTPLCSPVVIVPNIAVVRIVSLLERSILTEVVRVLITWPEISSSKRSGVDIIAPLSSLRLVHFPDPWEGPRLLLYCWVNVTFFSAVAFFCNFLTSSSRIFLLQKLGVCPLVRQYPQNLVAFYLPF